MRSRASEHRGGQDDPHRGPRGQRDGGGDAQPAQGCADRLMARLSHQSTTTTSATNDSVKVFGVAEQRRWP